MYRIIATLVLVQIASAVYGQGQTLNKSLMHDGISRNYTIYVPSSYTPQNNAALVINLHGYTLNRSFQMTSSGMNAVAEREGFLVAYPDAVNADWFGPQDNIGFVDRLLDDVASQYSVNAAKVYATGFSQGGMMSYVLGVALQDRFAAIASVGGTRPLASGDVLFPPTIAATPSRPFSLLHIHGTGDPIVPYNGGVSTVGSLTLNFPPVDRLIHEYVVNNGGSLTPNIVDLPNTNTTDGTTVQMFSYDGGAYFDKAGMAREAEVLLYRIQNGGHNWPGEFTGWPGWAFPINRDFNVSAEIWNFFSRHEVAAIPELSCLWLAFLGGGLWLAGYRCRRQSLSANARDTATFATAVAGWLVVTTSVDGAVISLLNVQFADVEIVVGANPFSPDSVTTVSGRAHNSYADGDRFTPSEARMAARSSAQEIAANATIRHRTGGPFQSLTSAEGLSTYDLYGLALNSGPVYLEFFLPPGFVEIESNSEARDNIHLRAFIRAHIELCRPDCESSVPSRLFEMQSDLQGG
jgi:polyhydroxybutyrate depolymerase